MNSVSTIPYGDSEDIDGFIGFVEHARSVLLSSSSSESNENVDNGDGLDPPWSWIVSRILKTCIAYSSGVTEAILLSELFQAWHEQHKYVTSKKKLECMISIKKRHKRTRLPNTVTIDSIYEKNFLSQSSVLEAFVVDAFLLPGTNIYMLTLADLWSSFTVDLYLHRRYYHLVELDHSILKKGREIFLTGCCLRTASEGSGHPRLLPTEYLVILLDEDKDEDAMLLGAQFCSDSFSSVSPNAANDGASYSFYTRIESIGPLEVQGAQGCLQRKQISLIDSYGDKLKFILWGEQVILANLLSVGSMLALDRPFISNITDNTVEMNAEVCLEYGSATQLYLVPYMQHEEQVLPTPTQLKYQKATLSTSVSQSQSLKNTQVSLPQNAEGSVDFSNYPYRLYVSDLHDKMTGISLCGVITNIEREPSTSKSVFFMTIEDKTGAIAGKLHFTKSWSLGRLDTGHTVWLSGLSCSITKKKLLQIVWFEKEAGSSIIDLSSLPALLNSSCLHQLSFLRNMKHSTNVCSIYIDRIEHSNVDSILSHTLCGHPVTELNGLFQCSLCGSVCDNELTKNFHLRLSVADESANIYAWCTGQTAAELLQISPDEFYSLPVDEQAMYLYTLENERYNVAIVKSKSYISKVHPSINGEADPVWKITRAQKCE